MENRFRLVQQPVASLQGDDPVMFDVLVRMVDTQGKEVLPAEFMAAAERNDLLKNIDRWVVGASLSFAAQRGRDVCSCACRRTPRKTAPSSSGSRIMSAPAGPSRSGCAFQVTEEVAASYIPQVTALAGALRQKGFRFALDGFGSGRDSQGLLDSVPLDFVKIDGALVQGLTGDPQLQQRVRTLVERRNQAAHPDHRRARRGCQHHGRAVAGWCAVHPGLFRQRARAGGAQGRRALRDSQSDGSGFDRLRPRRLRPARSERATPRRWFSPRSPASPCDRTPRQPPNIQADRLPAAASSNSSAGKAGSPTRRRSAMSWSKRARCSVADASSLNPFANSTPSQ